MTDTLPPSFAPVRRSARAATEVAPIAVGSTLVDIPPTIESAQSAAPASPETPILAASRPTPAPVVPRQSFRAAPPAIAPVGAPGTIPPAYSPVARRSITQSQHTAPASYAPKAAPVAGPPVSITPAAIPPAVPRASGAPTVTGLPSNTVYPAYPPQVAAPPQYATAGMAPASVPSAVTGAYQAAYPVASYQNQATLNPQYPGVQQFGPSPTSAPKRKKHKGLRIAVLSLVGLLVLTMAWPVGLMVWANGQINHVSALSGAPNTPGTTFLLVGSDERAEDGWLDEVSGARTDTIMVLHRPRHGTTSLVSLPRDSFVEIPGRSPNKINAAYAFGGAPLLVETVEHLTGLTIDHYVEVGMGGLMNIVDVVGGVELCMDRTVNDEFSQLNWTAGCHTVDGFTALAFARMRHADPLGDIGRVQRQQQLISAITHSLARPDLLLHPREQASLLSAGIGSVAADDNTSILNFGTLALAFRAANGPDGFRGTPPISDPDYRPGNIGSTVLLDPATINQFWAEVRNGTIPPTE